MEKKTRSEASTLRSAGRLRTIRTLTEIVKRASEVDALMGEVRVPMRLANGVDEALVRRGLLASDQVRYYETTALVDTGAIRSMLPVQVLQHLGLGVVRRARAVYANDSREEVDVSEMVGIDISVDTSRTRRRQEMSRVAVHS